jgi:hypothetical protein
MNLAIRGVGSVLMILLECMGWVYGKILGGVGGKFYSNTIFEVGNGSKVSL